MAAGCPRKAPVPDFMADEALAGTPAFEESARSSPGAFSPLSVAITSLQEDMIISVPVRLPVGVPVRL